MELESQSLLNEVKFPTYDNELSIVVAGSQSLLNEVKFPTKEPEPEYDYVQHVAIPFK